MRFGKIIGVAAAALVAAFSGAVGYHMGASHAAPTEYALRAQLFAEATQYVGVCTPEDAANVWAQGVMKRSAAMQYAVMSPELQRRYARSLERTAPGYVTGTSSPWVSACTIVSQRDTGPDTTELTLDIDTATSTGPAETLHAVLTVRRYGNFWRITAIRADEALDAYTGMAASSQG